MLRRTLISLVAILAAVGPALAQTAKPNPRVKLETAQGEIVLELFLDKAPITAGNYLKYVDRGLFNGASFYRASRPAGYTANDYGVVQGGLQNDPKKLLAPIAHEPTTKTGILHTTGVISMGRRAPGTATADWFICLGEQTYLDADPKDPKTPGFAAFGRVVSGLEVVQKIIGLPVDPNRGEGAMKGEMLKAPVRIIRATRLRSEASAVSEPAPAKP